MIEMRNLENASVYFDYSGDLEDQEQNEDQNDDQPLLSQTHGAPSTPEFEEGFRETYHWSRITSRKIL